MEQFEDWLGLEQSQESLNNPTSHQQSQPQNSQRPRQNNLNISTPNIQNIQNSNFPQVSGMDSQQLMYLIQRQQQQQQQHAQQQQQHAQHAQQQKLLAMQQQFLMQNQPQSSNNQPQSNQNYFSQRPTVSDQFAARISQLSKLSHNEWLKFYLEFMKNIKKELSRMPLVADKPLDIRGLFEIVVDLGGFEKVTMEQKWPLVIKKVFQESSVLSLDGMKNTYQTLLFDFEKRLFPYLSSSAAHLSFSSTMAAKNSAPNVSTMNHAYPSQSIPRNINFTHANYQNANFANNIPSNDKNISSQSNLANQNMHNISSNQNNNIQNSKMLSYPSRQSSQAINQPVKISAPNETISRSFKPLVKRISTFGGIESAILNSDVLQQKTPIYPIAFDMHRIKMAIQSNLDSEIKYAIDCLLMISCRKSIVFQLEKYSCIFKLLVECMQMYLMKAFGNPIQTPFIDYKSLFEADSEDLETFQKDSKCTFTIASLSYAERALALGTIFRNLSFSSENEQIMINNSLLQDVLINSLMIDISASKLSLKEAGVLEHRKNFLLFLSNCGSLYVIPPDHSSLIIDILGDFMDYSDSPYSYIALEALAKLSLVEKNRDSFLSCISTAGFYKIITGAIKMLPLGGLSIDATPEDIATWELSSLLLYNLTEMDDDRLRLLIVQTPTYLSMTIRIIKSGFLLGDEPYTDYVSLVTSRMLSSLFECCQSTESISIIKKVESTLIDLMWKLKTLKMSMKQKEMFLKLTQCICLL